MSRKQQSFLLGYKISSFQNVTKKGIENQEPRIKSSVDNTYYQPTSPALFSTNEKTIFESQEKTLRTNIETEEKQEMGKERMLTLNLSVIWIQWSRFPLTV